MMQLARCFLLIGKIEYRQVLARFYLRKIDDQAWPPVKMSNFISLALIKDHISQHQTIQTSVDGIVGKRESISYEYIFDNLVNLKFILFEGRPGSGKTTLMTRISQDWASGKFLESKLLFLIPLRQLNTYNKRSLSTLIEVACSSFKPDEIKSLECDVQRADGENVVFIFDGFDEYSPISDDIVLGLINTKRNFLRDALIVVSSRPAACQIYRQHADKRIEVVGFMKEHIVQYIQHYYSNDMKKAQQLQGHLKHHPNLMNMCYLPLHCAMLVFLYDETAILPKTETEFYKHFTISTLLRSSHKHDGSVTYLTSFDQLSPTDKTTFDNVCKLAFKATVAKNQVFRFSELQEMSLKSGSIGTDESCLGLVVIDRYFMRYGLDETYTFLHLTFQEYLAAVYISGLHPSEQICIINQYRRRVQDMEVVYRFLCGMLDFKLTDAMMVFKTMQSCPNVSVNKLVQWAYESQSQLPYDYLLCKLWNGRIYLDCFYSWGVSDGPAMAALLNNKNIHTVMIEFLRGVPPKDAITAAFDLVDNKALQVIIDM